MNIWDIKKLVISEDQSFKSYSQESLEQMRSTVSKHWATKYLNIATNASPYLFVLIALWVYVAKIGPQLSAETPFAIAFGHTVIGGVFVGIGFILGAGVSFLLDAAFCDLVLNPEMLKLALTPLVKTEKGCDEALNHIKCSLAKDYRDAVIAQGRELVVLDLYIMENLAKEETIQQEQSLRKEKCIQLHSGSL